MGIALKSHVRQLLPERALLAYHRVFARMAALAYHFPSHEMIVIGVTGTKGKTSTANYLWAALRATGASVAQISTANIRINDTENINPFHMTMPGRFTLQRLMAQARRKGCTWCIVETTSEGIKQSRHAGIVYDIVVLTNLTPEHLRSHGGKFENYRDAKATIFRELAASYRKAIDGRPVPKVIVVNADSDQASHFLAFDADRKVTFSIRTASDIKAERVTTGSGGAKFSINDQSYTLSILGAFNVYNALPAIAIANVFDLPSDRVAAGLASLASIPGRMELINESQPFTVIVDYAHEKESMTGALNAARNVAGDAGRVIVLLGAEGGGRDTAKRGQMGKVAAEIADVVITSNVDPYEDDPFPIANDIAVAAEQHGKRRDHNLFVILDRREGIRKALSIAENGDVVLITGKGAEQSITIGGKTMPWDDRVVVREEIEKLRR
ncbi:MAG: UDP-N-acetylmuramoyl-L-alanyl-D-glutamate--2,6-diaminopimelate ligase [Patescibacteria group bacterium]